MTPDMQRLLMSLASELVISSGSVAGLTVACLAHGEVPTRDLKRIMERLDAVDHATTHLRLALLP